MQSTIRSNRMFLNLLSDRDSHWAGGSPFSTTTASIAFHLLVLFSLIWVKVEIPKQQLGVLLDIQLIGLQAAGDQTQRQITVPEKKTGIQTEAKSRPTHDPINLADAARVSNTQPKLVWNAIPHRVPQARALTQHQQVQQTKSAAVESDPAPIIFGTSEPVAQQASGEGRTTAALATQPTEVIQSSGASETSAASAPPATPLLAGIGTPDVGNAVAAVPQTLADANLDTLSAMEARTTQIPLNIYDDAPWASVAAGDLELSEKNNEFSDFHFGNSHGYMVMQFGYREYLPRASFLDFEQALKINSHLMEVATAHAGADSWQTRQFRTNEAILIACLGNDEKAGELADLCTESSMYPSTTTKLRTQASLYLELADIAIYHEKLTLAEQLMSKAEKAARNKAEAEDNKIRISKLQAKIVVHRSPVHIQQYSQNATTDGDKQREYRAESK